MAQLVKVFAKADGLGLIPESTWWESRFLQVVLCPLNACIMGTPTHRNRVNNYTGRVAPALTSNPSTMENQVSWHMPATPASRDRKVSSVG